MLIVAFMGVQGVGDFVCYHMCSASVARAFPDARLVVVYRDDRPYKNFITSLNPYVTTVFKVPAEPDRVIPMDWFDGAGFDPDHPMGEAWYEQGLNCPDLVLVPSMMGADTYRDWGPPVKLRVPPDAAVSLQGELERRGVDPDRWFVCIHMRENYALRRNVDPGRSVDPTTYVPMITRIIENQGGQVIRVGDPDMSPLPDMDGLIDLTRDEDAFPLHAFAISRARYFIGNDSGPQTLASAFKVPTAVTNSASFCAWNDGDVVLPRPVTLPNGDPVDPAVVAELGVATHHVGRLEGVVYGENTPQQLCDVADHMHRTTADCLGWRADDPDGEIAPTDSVTVPLPWHDISGEGAVTVWR